MDHTQGTLRLALAKTHGYLSNRPCRLQYMQTGAKMTRLQLDKRRIETKITVYVTILPPFT